MCLLPLLREQMPASQQPPESAHQRWQGLHELQTFSLPGEAVAQLGECVQRAFLPVPASLLAENLQCPSAAFS